MFLSEINKRFSLVVQNARQTRISFGMYPVEISVCKRPLRCILQPSVEIYVILQKTSQVHFAIQKKPYFHYGYFGIHPLSSDLSIFNQGLLLPILNNIKIDRLGL